MKIKYTHNQNGKAINFSYHKDSDQLENGYFELKVDENLNKIPEDTSQYDTQEYKDAQSLVQYRKDRVVNNDGYKPNGCQHDAFWHDIDAGLFGENAKTGSFYLENKDAKDRYPKP